MIDDRVKARVRAILAYAAKNWYRPGLSETIPGDDPRYVATLDTYRVVFSYTEMETKELLRHLSISVPSKDYPNPFVVWTFADLFGFTGWDGQSTQPPETWMWTLDKAGHCIIVAQEVKDKKC